VCLYLIDCQPPRNQYLRAEDDQEATGDDHAAVGNHHHDPTRHEEKEAHVAL